MYISRGKTEASTLGDPSIKAIPGWAPWARAHCQPEEMLSRNGLLMVGCKHTFNTQMMHWRVVHLKPV